MEQIVTHYLKRPAILLLFLSSFVASFAQELLFTLEAENAELTAPSKVKQVNGYSGNAYVGDNDPGSAMVFKNVNAPEEGTYEFQTYYTSMHVRSIAIQSGYYPAVISTGLKTTEDWNLPPVETTTTYIWLNKGANTIRITPHNGGGPNIDKFEIRTTPVSMLRPEINKAAFAYDLTDDALITVNNRDETASTLNDNDEFSVFQYSGARAEVYIECDMPYLVTGYLLSAGAGSTQNVRNWALEYAPDGKNYQYLASSQTIDLPTATFFQINRHPHSETHKAAQYYRLTAQGGSIGEIQLFGLPYLPNTNGKNFPADITESQNIQAQTLGNPAGTLLDFADERCYNLFDRDMSKKYYWGSCRTFEVEIELDTPYTLGSYTLTSCQDYPERDPKSWMVEGFNTDWEPVGEVRDFIFPCRYATMKFPADDTKKYRGFRLRTVENNGADAFQLLKWQLFEGRTETNIEAVDLQSLAVFSSDGEIIIQSEENGMYRISDLSGQLLASQVFEAGTQRIQAEQGIYIVKIKIGSNVVVQKIKLR
ncbi:MAG: DUF6383 domain-containing protein [Candidatus Symbiothrix sp.]|jgi:hypothetical protein|nr:DUF6383 domain-containing protein [Candidatus Symbiothrix sp.]